jgi:MoaA/NifB/PqqE/SkfB family radical SAM enzyme
MDPTAPTAATSPFSAGRTLKTYELFLGYACDEKCLFCSQETSWRSQPAQTFEDVARRIFLARREGRDVLALNGGEPTLRRDILKIVSFARRAGFEEVHMQSNGLRLSDPDFCGELVRAGLTSVRLSIHGHDDALHDGQVLVPGALRRALAAIANLRRLGAEAGVNTVINRRNVAALPDFYRYFLDVVGVKDFGLIYPLYEGDMAVNADAMRVPMSEAAPFIRAAFEVFRERGAEPPILLNIPPCVLPGYESRILRWSSDGAAYFDAAHARLIDPAEYELAQPDGATRTLDESSREGKTKPASCRSCVYDSRCLGVERRYAALFGAGELRPLAAEPKPFDADWGVDSSRWRRLLTPKESAARREEAS